MPRPRYFTPAEADALVPHLSARLRSVSDHVQKIRRLNETIAEGADQDLVAAEIAEIKDEVDRVVAEIAREGVEVKGLEPALLDFPALMNGHEVYLCWREGEGAIGWWHPLHTGIGGRQRLDLSLLPAFEWEN